MSGINKFRCRASWSFLHKGGRSAQEDYTLVDREKGIFVVADGFGGPVAGAQAAKLACEAVRSFLFKEAGDLEATLPFELRSYFSLAGNVLFNALIFANRKLMAMNKGKNVHERGGASVIAGFIDGDLLALANVGLCNAWLFRKGQSVGLVTPRTFGKLYNPFSKSDPHRQAPLIALGMSNDLEPEIFEYKVKKGDWIGLASDGIPPEAQIEMSNLQLNNNNLENAAKDLNKYLEQLQYVDNAAISLVFI